MPIFEYEKKETAACSNGEKVIIEVKCIQRELKDISFFSCPAFSAGADAVLAYFQDDEEDLEPLLPEELTGDGEIVGEYTVVSEGTISCEDGLLKLTYLERLDEEADAPTQVSLTFPAGKDGPVAVSRTGAMRTIFTVEEGARQYSVYNTPYGKIDMCVIGKKIENRINSQGGVLWLDYAVELRGMIAQRTKMTVRVKLDCMRE